MVRGLVLYEGESSINNDNIVVIATFNTSNHKTGPMVQTWILHMDHDPVTATKSAKDEAVCGMCPFRPIFEDLCYVITYMAPQQVWKSYRQGRYPMFDPDNRRHRGLFMGRKVRLGAYGDPTAVPIEVWDPVLDICEGHTGYTHQWAQFPEYRKLLMASVHSNFEAQCAHELGWRTYRTRHEDQPVEDYEVVCPASDEGGQTRNCHSCSGCNGNAGESDTRKSFVIIGHLAPNKREKLDKFHLLQPKGMSHV